MHFTNILTIAALASTAMAGFSARPTHGGKHVATGDEDSAKKPEHHYIRDAARKHSGDHAVHYDPKHAHHARDAREHFGDHAGKHEPKHDNHAREHGEKGEKGENGDRGEKSETHSIEKGDAHDQHEGKIERRDNGVVVGVYWCTKNNWKGTCTKVPADNKCRKWNNGAVKGSLGPDAGVTCHFYEGSDCKGAVSSPYRYPGTDAVYFFDVGTGTFADNYAPEGWKCYT
jgi:hypothetical protein